MWCVPFSGTVGLFNKLQTRKKEEAKAPRRFHRQKTKQRLNTVTRIASSHASFDNRLSYSLDSHRKIVHTRCNHWLRFHPFKTKQRLQWLPGAETLHLVVTDFPRDDEEPPRVSLASKRRQRCVACGRGGTSQCGSDCTPAPGWSGLLPG